MKCPPTGSYAKAQLVELFGEFLQASRGGALATGSRSADIDPLEYLFPASLHFLSAMTEEVTGPVLQLKPMKSHDKKITPNSKPK